MKKTTSQLLSIKIWVHKSCLNWQLWTLLLAYVIKLKQRGKIKYYTPTKLLLHASFGWNSLINLLWCECQNIYKLCCNSQQNLTRTGLLNSKLCCIETVYCVRNKRNCFLHSDFNGKTTSQASHVCMMFAHYHLLKWCHYVWRHNWGFEKKIVQNPRQFSLQKLNYV